MRNYKKKSNGFIIQAELSKKDDWYIVYKELKGNRKRLERVIPRNIFEKTYEQI